MSSLVDEVHEWNTPVVSAYLLWRFTKEYIIRHPSGEAPVIFLHFIVDSILSNDSLSSLINGHRQNLASYVRYFYEDKKTDILACLSHRILERRNHVLLSIDIALSTGLLALDSNTATLHSATVTIHKGGYRPSNVIDKLGKKAEILAKWFSSEDFFNITSCLGVLL